MARSTQYIRDRCGGKSKIDEYEKPPNFPLFFPPFPIIFFIPLLEQNLLCEKYGTVGFVDSTNKSIRKKLFTVALIANVLAINLSIWSCFSISSNFGILKAAAFSYGEMKILDRAGTHEVKAYVGLTTMAVEITELDTLSAEGVEAIEDIVGETVTSEKTFDFGSFCDTDIDTDDVIPYLVEEESCADCADSSNGLIMTVIMGTVTIIFSIGTDFTRMYHNYDLNCQKFFASVVGFISLIGSVSTWIGYSQVCFASLYDGTLYVLTDGTVVGTPPDEDVQYDTIEIEWQPGIGLYCIFAAMALKFIDIVISFVVPTPAITRDQTLQDDYEVQFGEKDEDKQDIDADKEVMSDTDKKATADTDTPEA